MSNATTAAAPDQDATFFKSGPTRADYLWDRRYKLTQRLQLGQTYHRCRERYFSLLDKWTKGVSAALSVVAVTKLFPPEYLVVALGAVATINTLSLFFSWGDTARKHADLAVSYGSLMADIKRVGERRFNESNLDAWDADHGQIEAKELAQYNALVHGIERDLAIAAGHPDHIKPLPFWKRWTAHVFNWSVK